MSEATPDNVTQPDNGVTDQIVTSRSAYTFDQMQADPSRRWGAVDVAVLLHVNRVAARKILSRLYQAGKITTVGHGMYQYDDNIKGGLLTLISRSGSIGFENMIFVTSGSPTPTGQPPCNDPDQHTVTQPDNMVTSQPIPKPGYPRLLRTGQEIRWEIWGNGSERLSFISRGNPFSPDLIDYLMDEISKDPGFAEKVWQRVSIEVNRDTETLTLAPECVTFQDTQNVIWKAYNHGKQLRLEDADRRVIPQGDILSTFLMRSDTRDGKAALKEIVQLRKDVRELQGLAQRADSRSRYAYSALCAQQGNICQIRPVNTAGGQQDGR
jgi:hypothetical protein